MSLCEALLDDRILTWEQYQGRSRKYQVLHEIHPPSYIPNINQIIFELSANFGAGMQGGYGCK